MLARLPLLIIGIPAVYGLLVHAGDLARLVLFILIALIGQYELNTMLSPKERFKPFPEWIATIFVLLSSHFYNEQGLLFSFSFAMVALVIFTVLRGMKGNGCKRFSSGLFSIIYLPFCLGFYLLLAQLKGGQLLFAIIASIWALDIGAYISGMSLRGPKLAPGISPNKTISGAIGGAISCIAFFALLKYFSFIELDELRFWILAGSVATIGQFADLFESVLKRESEIKDSGAVFGAHGGILDRIDSILFLGPICYALVVI
ncbi:MAG: phosphatidate cytidylyltransferase [Candidatus Rifleibacteriota bacterium]